MRALVVYESMYGNTHLVANCIAEGLRDKACDVTVVPVSRAAPDVVAGTDLIVVGGPTHVHGMTSNSSRKAAVDAADKPGSALSLEPDASGPGLRDWLHILRLGDGTAAAAFDTRVDGGVMLTGRASNGIARRLRQRGYHLVVPAQSFLVSKQNTLLDGEADRAQTWGAALAFAAGPVRHVPSP